MIGLALSGGGSRAIAFHLGCLRALDDLGVLEQVGVLSTISGGSVIGAYWAYTPGMPFCEFELRMREVLRRGFQRGIALSLADPLNLIQCAAGALAVTLQDAGRLIGLQFDVPELKSITDLLGEVLRRSLFNDLQMGSPRRRDLDVVIGSCDLITGAAFRFGNRRSGSWRHGEVASNDVSVAFAVAASAAYPIFLPAVERTWRFRRGGVDTLSRLLLTDGGVYDNLGIDVIEPGRDPGFSLHTFGCDSLIVCNAGRGQESAGQVTRGFLPRIIRSFETVHRRVQDSAMHRLHLLKQVSLLRGFALPYLGQQDERLPWRPSGLVPRSEVVDYPANFAAMSDAWIDRLASRGEQLTRILVSNYLSELVR